jgi:hypothetical protein
LDISELPIWEQRMGRRKMSTTQQHSLSACSHRRNSEWVLCLLPQAESQ